MEDNGIYGNIFLINRPPFVETNFSSWMEHSNFATDSTRNEYICWTLAHINRSPSKGIEIFPKNDKLKFVLQNAI